MKVVSSNATGVLKGDSLLDLDDILRLLVFFYLL